MENDSSPTASKISLASKKPQSADFSLPAADKPSLRMLVMLPGLSVLVLLIGLCLPPLGMHFELLQALHKVKYGSNLEEDLAFLTRSANRYRRWGQVLPAIDIDLGSQDEISRLGRLLLMKPEQESLSLDDDNIAALTESFKRSPERHRVLSELLEKLAALDQKLLSNRGEIKTIAERRTSLEQQESLISADLAALFTLQLEPKDQGDTYPRYEAGILKDFPKLARLADGIVDLQSLREALSIAGGEVSLKGPNVPEEFNRKIAEMRSLIEATDTESDDLLDEEHTVLNSIKENTEERVKNISQINLIARELLDLIATPKVSISPVLRETFGID